MTSLLYKIHDVHGCLKFICEVESELFSTSLLGIFKKKNFTGNQQMLEVACRKLGELNTSIFDHYGTSDGVDVAIMDTTNYIDALITSTEKLIEITKRLSDKAMGGQYPMHVYSQHLAEFKALQDDYCTKGDRMNANYRLYLREIVALDD